jgi:hypothetical protein
MRIFTLLVISIFIYSTSTAQQKGNVLVGGSIGFFEYDSDNFGTVYDQTDFYLNPSVGKFYANNRMAGVNLIYGHSKFRDSLSGNTLGAGVFLRQFKPLGKSFFLFAEEGLNGYKSKYNDYAGSPAEIKTKEAAIYLNFYPGLAYAVNKNLWLELALPQLFSITYATRKFKNKTIPEPNENNVKLFSVTSGLNNWSLGNLSFGVRWMIGKK